MESSEKYSFESHLTPQQIKSRLELYAKPMTFSHFNTEKAVLWKPLSNGNFYLQKRGDSFRMHMGGYAFHGHVETAQSGSRIGGSFRPLKRNSIACFLLLLLVGLLFHLPFWLAILVAFLGGAAPYLPLHERVNRREYEETLEFINKHLLE